MRACILYRLAFAFLLVIAFSQQVTGQDLPAWTAEDRARLKKGDIIAGAGLLVDDLPTRNQPAPDPEIPGLPEEDPEPAYDPELIPEELLSNYFSTTPQSYLIDPQKLLSRQESMDREGFLEYHAAESAVDIRLYLFDAQQKIPSQYSLQKLAEERYAKSDLTAVVFCFLGDPSRNMLAFGGKEAESQEATEIRRILENSKLKAMEKSDAAAQVEAFVVELSIKLYWMERSMVQSQIKNAGPKKAAADGGESREIASEPTGAMAKVRPYLLYLVIGGASIALVLLGSVGMFLLWSRSRKYHFPVLDIPRRLGADYAAGVGAVLAFHNKHGSPSAQRDQVPDYFMRM